jgi:hypothetical protein
MTEMNPAKSINPFVRPTLATKFKIDFDWWKENDKSWRVFLTGYLCEEHQAFFGNAGADVMVDSVNPETGAVTQIDQLQDTLINHCARMEDFFQDKGTLTDSVFRVFLSNGNAPLDAEEISQIINRPADTILKTLSGPRIYRGVRPIL